MLKTAVFPETQLMNFLSSNNTHIVQNGELVHHGAKFSQAEPEDNNPASVYKLRSTHSSN